MDVKEQCKEGILTALGLLLASNGRSVISSPAVVIIVVSLSWNRCIHNTALNNDWSAAIGGMVRLRGSPNHGERAEAFVTALLAVNEEK
jgi:hypothetical protein